MKKLLIFCFSILLFGCNSNPIRVEKTNNPAVQAQLLFEKDGYKIYRFEDGGRNVYYVVPEGQAMSVYSESCGKNCTREVNIDTKTLNSAAANTNKKQ